MTWSPILKRVISLGVVDKAVAEEGSKIRVEWTVEGTRERVGATVVQLPFLDLARKRA
jgi:glycine cleavage system aminomethyltransferase T